MPPVARIGDATEHPLPPGLTGVGAPTVMIGMWPAWKGIPLALAAGVQAAQQASESAINTAEGIAVAAEAAAVAGAAGPQGPALATAATTARATAESLKASSAAAMSATISAAAAGGASIHICAVPWPLPPHGPGVVIDGSATVMIENMPACRMGNTIVEAIGPPNKILMGCVTVVVGG
jgi:uncharacterized Zn-binding protein involved in type VI secretion